MQHNEQNKTIAKVYDSMFILLIFFNLLLVLQYMMTVEDLVPFENSIELMLKTVLYSSIFTKILIKFN